MFIYQKSDHIISHHIIYLENQFNRNIENGFQSNLFQLVVHLSTPFEDLFDEFLHHLLPLHSSLIERDVSLKKYICGLLVSAAFAGSVLHQYPRSGLPVQIPFPLHSVMEISIWNINFSMCYVMNMLRFIFVFIWCVLVTWRWKKLTLKSFPPPFILFNWKHWHWCWPCHRRGDTCW